MSDNLNEKLERQNELLEEQNRLAEEQMRQETEWREQEERRRREEEEERQEREEYENARPVCVYCREKIDYSTGSACYEYCCKKCAVADLGRDKVEDYMDHVGYYNLSRKLDSLIRGGRNLEALLLSEGMNNSFSVEQNVFLAKQHANYQPVIGRNLEKAKECLRFVLDTLEPAKKGKWILSLYEDDQKYGGKGAELGSYLIKELLDSGEDFIGLMTMESQLSLGKALLKGKGWKSSLTDKEISQTITAALESGFYSLDDLDRQKEIALELMDEAQYPGGYKNGILFLSAILNADDQDGEFNREIRKALAALSIGALKAGRDLCQNGLLASFLDEEINFYRTTIRKYRDQELMKVRQIIFVMNFFTFLCTLAGIIFVISGAFIGRSCVVMGFIILLGARFFKFLKEVLGAAYKPLKDCIRNDELVFDEDMAEAFVRIKENMDMERSKRAASF